MLLASPDIITISGVVNCAFAMVGSRLYEFYLSAVESLLTEGKNLRRNYKNSVFACMTFNFGPQTITRMHRDFLNLAWGWCAITVLGHFDPDRGGHHSMGFWTFS